MKNVFLWMLNSLIKDIYLEVISNFKWRSEYDINLVVEFVRFIRNVYDYFKFFLRKVKFLLVKNVFLEYFFYLVMDVFELC